MQGFGNIILRAEFVNGIFAIKGFYPVIVNNHIAAHSNFSVKQLEDIPGGFVKIYIGMQQRNSGDVCGPEGCVLHRLLKNAGGYPKRGIS
jgi:hypothetical protein